MDGMSGFVFSRFHILRRDFDNFFDRLAFIAIDVIGPTSNHVFLIIKVTYECCLFAFFPPTNTPCGWLPRARSQYLHRRRAPHKAALRPLCETLLKSRSESALVPHAAGAWSLL